MDIMRKRIAIRAEDVRVIFKVSRRTAWLILNELWRGGLIRKHMARHCPKSYYTMLR